MKSTALQKIEEWAETLDYNAEWLGDPCLSVVKEMRAYVEKWKPIISPERTTREVDQTEQRDHAEEAANRALMQDDLGLDDVTAPICTVGACRKFGWQHLGEHLYDGGFPVGEAFLLDQLKGYTIIAVPDNEEASLAKLRHRCGWEEDITDDRLTTVIAETVMDHNRDCATA